MSGPWQKPGISPCIWCSKFAGSCWEELEAHYKDTHHFRFPGEGRIATEARKRKVDGLGQSSFASGGDSECVGTNAKKMQQQCLGASSSGHGGDIEGVATNAKKMQQQSLAAGSIGHGGDSEGVGAEADWNQGAICSKHIM